MYVDFKVTTWERVQIPEEIKEDVLNKIKTGEINSADDIFSEFDHENLSCDVIDEIPTEQMSVEENGGSSTIEVYKDKDTPTTLWQNGESF